MQLHALCYTLGCMIPTASAKTVYEVKALLQTNKIEIDQVVYEIDRIYCGKKSAALLIEEQLMKAKNQIAPLTNPTIVLYNNDSGAGMSKEVI